MPTVKWTNGKVDSAHSWQALLDNIRRTQWHRYDEQKFRDVMGHRARIWSGTKINTDGTAEQFMRELAYARLIVIIDETETDHDDDADKYLLESK